jgi:hypothetical protein
MVHAHTLDDDDVALGIVGAPPQDLLIGCRPVPIYFIAFLLLASLAVILVVAAAPALFILVPIDLSLAHQSVIQLAQLEAAGR